MKKCPNCGLEFEPVLKRQTGEPAQVEFPHATAWQREQLISGICSDACWRAFLGMGGSE